MSERDGKYDEPLLLRFESFSNLQRHCNGM